MELQYISNLARITSELGIYQNYAVIITILLHKFKSNFQYFPTTMFLEQFSNSFEQNYVLLMCIRVTTKNHLSTSSATCGWFQSERVRRELLTVSTAIQTNADSCLQKIPLHTIILVYLNCTSGKNLLNSIQFRLPKTMK